jgi:hypothetical protein
MGILPLSRTLAIILSTSIIATFVDAAVQILRKRR